LEPELAATIDDPATDATAINEDRVAVITRILVSDPRRKLHRVHSAQFDRSYRATVSAPPEADHALIVAERATSTPMISGS
jgi:hypothetical protein